MTRTVKTETTMPGRRRAAVTGALGLAAVALTAVPAHAKGTVEVTAPRTAAVGKTFTVTAHGDDDAASYLRICLQERSGGQAWHQVTCGAVAERGGAEAQAVAHPKSAHRGPVEFRAVAYGLTGPHDQHPKQWRTSTVATVQVR
ncbi:hypothetical protein [Streptomyces benahoarensis]|uniref:Secreted protein n=1 Tax=Streptomyces benahoarensis TaxID=2595054 RepID=A0A553Z5P1_9ACTN|nr:hypothetical protein [Streptomyces benahoarensis]TSB19247.1 hypothetical protein FNJ62_22850 [Streptomyces benahoarensis]TSB36787.1 hypothetical protein FNZ23_19245 [Streptomyces benahoarensis]